MSLSAQQFKDRILLHRTATRTPLETRLDTKALARKESILMCQENIKARCKFWVRALDAQGEQVYADVLTITFDDPRLAQPPTKMFLVAQECALETHAKLQWQDIVWERVAKLVQFKEPEILHYYDDQGLTNKRKSKELLETEFRAVPSVVDVSKLSLSPDPVREQALDHNDKKQAQVSVAQLVTTSERTPTSREVLARMAAQAREKRKTQEIQNS